MESEKFIVWCCTETNCLFKNQSPANRITITRWSKRGNGWMELVCQNCGKSQPVHIDDQAVRDLQKQTRGQIRMHTVGSCKELAERLTEVVQIEPMSPEIKDELFWELKNVIDAEYRDLCEIYRSYIRGLAPRKSYKSR